MRPQDMALLFWPPRSPDFRPCDFFLWGYVKDRVFVPPLATDLDDIKNRITAAVTSVAEDTLRGIWDEFSMLSVQQQRAHRAFIKEVKKT
jgi:hypothetical protein